jgi:hypothetical protein
MSSRIVEGALMLSDAAWAKDEKRTMITTVMKTFPMILFPQEKLISKSPQAVFCRAEPLFQFRERFFLDGCNNLCLRVQFVIQPDVYFCHFVAGFYPN